MAAPPVRSASRNAAATRQAILNAARTAFARESYDAVGVREIAGSAGVDPALVNRYFGSKEALFKCVLSAGKPEALFSEVTREKLPEFLAGLLMDADETARAEKLDKLLIILRSATSPAACEMVREAMTADMLAPMAALLEGEDAQFRASLAMSVLMGTAIIRSVMAVGPMCDHKEAKVADGITRLFRTAFEEARVL